MKLTRSLGYEEAVKAAQYLQAQWSARPRVGIILGSGLSDAARRIQVAKTIPYSHVPHFPRPTVPGHRGALHLGLWRRVPVAVLEGRLHLYEGYRPDEVAFPARVLAVAGVSLLVVTCAAGGITPRAVPGSLMGIADHLNLQGVNPLAGPHDDRWGERFLDLTQAYDPAWRRKARGAAKDLRLEWSEGVYAALPGPSYETPAEIRALKRLGADAVGMSTVPEVLAARQMGLPVLAIAAITNRAAGLGGLPLSHREVLTMGRKASRDLASLLGRLLSLLASEAPRRRPG